MNCTKHLQAALTAALCVAPLPATAHEPSNAGSWRCTPTGPDQEWHCASRSLLPPTLRPTIEYAAPSSEPRTEAAMAPTQGSLREALASAPEEAWVLQLNAVVDPAAIRAQQLEMGKDRAAVIEIMSGRQQLWALIHGLYPDRASAQSAATQLNTVAYARSVRSLRQVLAANL